MSNTTKEQAINSADVLMKKFAPYHINGAHLYSEASEPYWIVYFILLDDEGNPIPDDPNAVFVMVDDKTGIAKIRSTP